MIKNKRQLKLAKRRQDNKKKAARVRRHLELVMQKSIKDAIKKGYWDHINNLKAEAMKKSLEENKVVENTEKSVTIDNVDSELKETKDEAGKTE